jgi:hypothetical protein
MTQDRNDRIGLNNDEVMEIGHTARGIGRSLRIA